MIHIEEVDPDWMHLNDARVKPHNRPGLVDFAAIFGPEDEEVEQHSFERSPSGSKNITV